MYRIQIVRRNTPEEGILFGIFGINTKVLYCIRIVGRSTPGHDRRRTSEPQPKSNLYETYEYEAQSTARWQPPWAGCRPRADDR